MRILQGTPDGAEECRIVPDPMVRIGIDAMGGDFAPRSTVLGAIAALENTGPDTELYLFGDRSSIEDIRTEAGAGSGTFFIVHCSETIGMEEQAVSAYFRKNDSSIAVGFASLAAGKIDAFVSAGNTGAMLVASMSSLKMVENMPRPCISVELPLISGKKLLLLDVGFNADCRPQMLFRFAGLGVAYARSVMGIGSPKVALLNIGKEAGKGASLYREAYALLEDGCPGFSGNIEPDRIWTPGYDAPDVVVTDGFTGNIVLKQAESVYSIAKARGITDSYLEQFNYEAYGGTPVLGVSAPVIIGHGISTPVAISNMIFKAKKIVEGGLIEKLPIFAT